MPSAGIDSLFRAGELLLPLEMEAGTGAETVARVPWITTLLVVVSILLFLATLRNFLNILPYILDNFTRARGSAALEGSVRVSRDRNLVALVLLIPTVLIIKRYRLYDPDFSKGFGDDMYTLVVAGAFVAYLILRWILTVVCRPSRAQDGYSMSTRSAFTFFILAALLVFPTVGALSLFGVNDVIIRTIILIEWWFVYGVYLIRKSQILASFCNPLAVFLYLCALELLPTGLYVASAMLF